MSKSPAKHTFESSMKRLETIVEKLEGGDATLEESLALYEEGIELSKTSMEKLSQAELKLKRITKNLDGSFELFDEQLSEKE